MRSFDPLTHPALRHLRLIKVPSPSFRPDFFPQPYEIPDHPLGGRDGGELWRVWLIFQDPSTAKDRNAKLKALAKRAPAAMTVDWIASEGFITIPPNTIVLSRLTTDLTSENDKPIAIASSPGFILSKHPDLIAQLDQLGRAFLYGDRSRRVASDKSTIPFECSPLANPTGQADRCYATMLTDEAQTQKSHPAASFRRPAPDDVKAQLLLFNQINIDLGVTVLEKGPRYWLEVMDMRQRHFNIPKVGSPRNRGLFTAGQINFGGIPIPGTEQSIVDSQGSAGEVHDDGGDCPFSLSTAMQQGDIEGLTSGSFAMMDFGFAVDTVKYAPFAFSGRGRHKPIPSSAPPGVLIRDWHIRVIYIAYPHNATVNGKSALNVSVTTAKRPVELDARYLAYPTYLKVSPQHANFFQDSGSIMSYEEHCEWAARTLLMVMHVLIRGLGLQDKFRIESSSVMSAMSYLVGGTYRTPSSWEELPSFEPDGSHSLRDVYAALERELALAGLHLPMIAAKTYEAVMEDSEALSRREFPGNAPKRPNPDDEEEEAIEKPVIYNTRTPPKCTKITEFCAAFTLLCSSMRETGVAMNSIVLRDEHFLTRTIGEFRDELNMSTISLVMHSIHQHHDSSLLELEKATMLTNVRHMAACYQAWTYLMIEVLPTLISNYYDVVESPEHWTAMRDSQRPWELVLLKLVHAYRKESTNSQCDLAEGVLKPSDVGAQHLFEEDSSPIDLRSALSAPVPYSDVEEDEFIITRVLAIMARWTSLATSKDIGDRKWMYWDYRGRLLHAIFRSGWTGLLLQKEISAFQRRPNSRVGKCGDSVQHLVDELEKSWGRWTVQQAVVLDNARMINIAEPGLVALQSRADLVSELSIASRLAALRPAPSQPPLRIRSTNTRPVPTSSSSLSPTPQLESCSHHGACSVVVKFLRAAAASIDNSLPKNAISDWILAENTCNIRSPFREQAPDRMWARAQMQAHSCRTRDDLKSKVFSLIVHRAITFNSQFTRADHNDRVFWFEDRTAFFDTLSTMTPRGLKFFANPNAHGGNPQVGRNPILASVYQVAADEFMDLFDQTSAPVAAQSPVRKVKFCDVHRFFSRKFISETERTRPPSLKEIGPLHALLLAGDFVYAGLAHSPSSSEFFEVWKKNKSKGAVSGLSLLRLHPTDFCTLYECVLQILGVEGRTLLPDVLHFEHTLCKLSRSGQKKAGQAVTTLVHEWLAELGDGK